MSGNSDKSTTALYLPLAGLKGFTRPSDISSSFVPSLKPKLLSITSSSTPSTTSSSSSSSSIINEYYLSSFLPDISFEMPNVNLITKVINDLFAEKIDSLLVQNTQVLLLGATLGAAISAGAFFGIFSVGLLITSPLSTGTSTITSSDSSRSYRIRSLRQKILHRLFGQRANNQKPTSSTTSNNGNVQEEQKRNENGNGNEKSNNNKENEAFKQQSTEGNGTKSNSNIIFLQGNPSITLETKINNEESGRNKNIWKEEDTFIEKQYRSCLDSMKSSLKDKGLSWQNVRQFSVKLVTTNDRINRQNAAMFREIFKEYHPPKYNEHNVILSIVFVLGLEDPDSVIQIDAMAV